MLTPFRTYQNACWAKLEPLGDALVVVATTALALRQRVAVAQHALFLATSLALAAWCAGAPASYMRWREAAAVCYRLAMFSPWAFWPGIIAMVDRSGASLWGDSVALNALKLAAVVPIASLVASNCIVAATKPVRLWATLLIQAATAAVALSQRGSLCATAALRHPAAERLFGSAYDALRWQLALLPLPVSLAAEHGPAGRCACVVGYVQLTMAFWGMVLASLAAEASMYARWQARTATGAAAAALAGPEGAPAPALTAGGAARALARSLMQQRAGPHAGADGRPRPPAPAPPFRAYQNACWVKLEPLGDAVAVLAAAALALRQRVAVAQCALCVAASLALTAWRAAAPASYLRWREAPAACLRLAVYSPWAFWPGIIAMVDRSGTALWGESEALNALKLAAVVPFVSVSNCVVAVVKPVRLWACVLIQAATVGVALSQRGSLCATAALRHPAAERLFGSAYDALRWQLALLPLPVSLAAEHGPAGRCACVVGYVQLTMAFWGMVLASLAAEASMYARWQARTATGAAAAALAGPEGAPAPALTAGGAARALARWGRQAQLGIYSTAMGWSRGQDRTWVVMLPMALATTFDWLCFATAS
eukprot:scaffold22.g6131.t1